MRDPITYSALPEDLGGIEGEAIPEPTRLDPQAATPAQRSGGGRRARRFSSRSTASRMNARRSSSPAFAASMRSSVPASNDINHFSGNLRIRPKIISVSRIRYVDSLNGVSHIRFSNKEADMTFTHKQRVAVLKTLTAKGGQLCFGQDWSETAEVRATKRDLRPMGYWLVRFADGGELCIHEEQLRAA